MQIQLNTDKHVVGSPSLQERVEQMLEQELKHLSDRITRIEVHLNDVNSAKAGDDDKRCQLEARLAGANPISVEHRAPNMELAIAGAAEQLARALANLQGKAEASSKRRESIRHMDPGGL
ncbi:MAG TPA: HPF/RaiA family ribosome-associated protein [Noviherbaspirillum sp.]|nr:HPF/RaiA family ribosome-associated protein [Noviherbaspirillum sp.]